MADRQMSLAEALLDPRMGRAGVIDWTPLEGLAIGVRSEDVGRASLERYRFKWNRNFHRPRKSTGACTDLEAFCIGAVRPSTSLRMR
jgi:hypothetical protein